MKKIAIAALLSAAVAAPAFAADNGFYAGVTLGQARTSTPTGLILNKSTDTVYGILGGYQFTKNWGVEAFFTGAGKWNTPVLLGTSASGKSDAYGASVVGTLPLSDTFSLYGKLGYASTKTSWSAVAAGVGAAASNTKRSAPTYGLGLQYNMNQNVGFRFGWDRYSANWANVSNYNSDVFSAAAVYKF